MHYYADVVVFLGKISPCPYFVWSPLYLVGSAYHNENLLPAGNSDPPSHFLRFSLFCYAPILIKFVVFDFYKVCFCSVEKLSLVWADASHIILAFSPVLGRPQTPLDTSFAYVICLSQLMIKPGVKYHIWEDQEWFGRLSFPENKDLITNRSWKSVCLCMDLK